MKINKYKVEEKDEPKFEELIKSIEKKLEKLKISELTDEFNELTDLIKKSYTYSFGSFLFEQVNGARKSINYLFEENWENILDFGDEDVLEIRKSTGEWIQLDNDNNICLISDSEEIKKKDYELYKFYFAILEASRETYLQIRESVVFNKEEFDKSTIIKICFESLMNGLKLRIIEKKSLKYISHYKLTVITGIILKEIKIDGVKLINDSISDSSVTFKEIHNSLVSHTKIFQKKCDIWLKD